MDQTVTIQAGTLTIDAATITASGSPKLTVDGIDFGSVTAPSMATKDYVDNAVYSIMTRGYVDANAHNDLAKSIDDILDINSIELTQQERALLIAEVTQCDAKSYMKGFIAAKALFTVLETDGQLEKHAEEIGYEKGLAENYETMKAQAAAEVGVREYTQGYEKGFEEGVIAGRSEAVLD